LPAVGQHAIVMDPGQQFDVGRTQRERIVDVALAAGDAGGAGPGHFGGFEGRSARQRS